MFEAAFQGIAGSPGIGALTPNFPNVGPSPFGLSPSGDA
jgi:hypothetical protein